MSTNLKKIERSTTFVRAKLMTVGQEIAGKFLGTTQGKFTKEHRIQTGQGKTTVLNGTRQLDSLMEQVAPGADLKVVYQGSSILTSGPNKGKPAHSFDVYSGDAPAEENVTTSEEEASADAPPVAAEDGF